MTTTTTTSKLSPMEMRRELLKKKEDLLTANKGQYLTEGINFKPFPTRVGVGINIQTASFESLEEVARVIVNVRDARILIDTPKDKPFLGYPLDSWISDIKLRQSKLNRTATLKKIDTLQRKLAAILTEEELREIGVIDVAADFADII